MSAPWKDWLPSPGKASHTYSLTTPPLNDLVEISCRTLLNAGSKLRMHVVYASHIRSFSLFVSTTTLAFAVL